MDDEARYWTGHAVTVGVAIIAVAMATAFQDVPLETMLIRALLFLIIGLSGLYVLRLLTEGRHGEYSSSTGRRRRGIGLALSLTVASALGLWWTLPQSAPASPAPPVKDAVHELADELSGKTWAEDGHDCTTQGIRMFVEENQLVAYPRGEPAIRYPLLGAHGRQLVTRSGNTFVSFEIRDDGFTLIEGGEVQWFGLCK